MWERGTVRGLRWIRWEGDELGRWEIFDFIQGWETQRKSKISSFFMLVAGTKRGRIVSRFFAWPPVISLQVLQKATTKIVAHAIYSYQFFSFTCTLFYSATEKKLVRLLLSLAN